MRNFLQIAIFCAFVACRFLQSATCCAFVGRGGGLVASLASIEALFYGSFSYVYVKKLVKKACFTTQATQAKNCTFEEDRMRKKMRAMEAARYRRGDEHPGAALTDAEVDLVRELNESGWSYSALADKFEVSKSTIAGICQCRRRA